MRRSGRGVACHSLHRSGRTHKMLGIPAEASVPPPGREATGARHGAPVWLQSDVEGGRAANHPTRPTSACDDRRAEQHTPVTTLVGLEGPGWGFNDWTWVGPRCWGLKEQSLVNPPQLSCVLRGEPEEPARAVMCQDHLALGLVVGGGVFGFGAVRSLCSPSPNKAPLNQVPLGTCLLYTSPSPRD